MFQAPTVTVRRERSTGASGAVESDWMFNIFSKLKKGRQRYSLSAIPNRVWQFPYELDWFLMYSTPLQIGS